MVETTIDIIVVDDDPADLEIAARTIKSVAPSTSTRTVCGGGSAIDLLKQLGGTSETANNLPQLVLLDLKMGALDGFDVLAALKADERTKSVPIVILSASDSRADIARSYGLGANGYLMKPCGSVEFRAMMTAVCGFWLCHNSTTTKDGRARNALPAAT